MKLALLKDNTVVAVTEVDTEDQVQHLMTEYGMVIDISNLNPMPQLGWTLEGNKLIGAVVVTEWKITRLAMRQRLTLTELTTFYAAANVNTMFKILLDNLSVATYIDLERADTRSGIGALAQAGVITPARLDEILNTPPRDYEIYRG